MTVIFSPEAKADLRHIRAYISRDNPQAALRMALRIVAACDRLEAFSRRGRPGKQPGTRELTTVRPYVIVYRTRPGIIDIVRIWHGRQDR